MFFVVRHGERGDQTPLEQALVQKHFDTHLSKVGHQQALLTGQYIKKKVAELVQAGTVDADVQVRVISSPYYRCLQTSRMIIEGLGNQLLNDTVYVESAVEEYQHPVCRFDETHRAQRFFDLRDPQVLAEVFPPALGRKFEANAIFDYGQCPQLLATFPENYETGTQRMHSWISELGLRTQQGQDDPRKVVNVVVCHGFFADGFSTSFAPHLFTGVHPYCCTHLGRVTQAARGQKPEVEVLVHAHFAW